MSERKPAAYEDRLGDDGVLAYRYRGTDLLHRDNVGLRLAMLRATPLVYFLGMVPGWYTATWPAFIAHDDDEHLTFTVLFDDSAFAHLDGTPIDMARRDGVGTSPRWCSGGFISRLSENGCCLRTTTPVASAGYAIASCLTPRTFFLMGTLADCHSFRMD